MFIGVPPKMGRERYRLAFPSKAALEAFAQRHDANASFVPSYTLRADKFGAVIEDKYAKCGCAIVRCSY